MPKPVLSDDNNKKYQQSLKTKKFEEDLKEGNEDNIFDIEVSDDFKNLCFVYLNKTRFDKANTKMFNFIAFYKLLDRDEFFYNKLSKETFEIYTKATDKYPMI